MPRLEYDVVFNLNQSSTETLEKNLNRIAEGGGLERANQDAKELNQTLLRTSNAAEEVGNDLSLSASDMDRFRNRTIEASTAMDRLADSSQQAGTDTRNMSKIANNSNQILFSFGDAVQDGAQFQYGFASGARAIGNNITYASEQIAIAIEKTGSFTGAMKSMGSALLGPAGGILLVNALVTAFTVLPNIVGESSEEINAFKESISQTNSELEEFILKKKGLTEDEPILSTERERAALETQLRNQESILDRARELRRERELQEAGRIFPGISQDIGNLSDLNKLISVTEERISELKTDISAQDLLATTPAGIDALAGQARSQIKTAFETQEDVIIPAEINIGNIGRIRDQVRQAFLPGTSPVIELEQPDIIGAGARQRAKERQQFFKKLGISEVEFERSIANSKVQIKKDEEQAKTAITKRQARTRTTLISQAASAAGNILSAAFGASKEVRIAMALMDTYAAAQSAYASQLIPGDPTSLGRAQVAAALAVASGLARVAQIATIEPGSSSGGGGDGRSSMNQGFTTTNINTSQRQQPNSEVANQTNQQGGDTIIRLEGEFDSRMVSVKAEEGKKLRTNNTIKARRSA